MKNPISFIRNKLITFYNVDWVKLSRKRYAHSELTNNIYKRKPLTSHQIEEIKKFWDKYIKLDKDAWSWYEIYNYVKPEDAALYNYIPANIYYAYVDPYFTKYRECCAIDDKNMYDLYFPNVLMPKTIIRKIGGVYLNNNYEIISKEKVFATCLKHKNMILKKSKESLGGEGIIFFTNTTKQINDIISTKNDFIIQDVIEQHRVLSSIHKESVNTLRIMSLFFNGEIHIMSSVLRMGTSEAHVDNASNGGIVAGIKKDGSLRPKAYNIWAQEFNKHPQGTIFNNIRIPSYDKCINIIRELAPRFIGVSKLISWDFTIDWEGNPVLIETNLTFGGLEVHQMSNGPVFGEMTADILDEVFKKKK